MAVSLASLRSEAVVAGLEAAPDADVATAITPALALAPAYQRDPAFGAMTLPERAEETFSVFEVLDNNAQRDELRAGSATWDAAVYINEAIAWAASHNFKAVYFPSGTYLLNGPKQGTAQVMLTLLSDLAYLGDGYHSRLKVADNYTALGDYRVFGCPELAGITNNVIVRGLHFDGNGLNNLVLGSTGGNIRRAYSVNMFKGSNILIAHNWVTNNPGRNCFNIGNNGNPIDFKNVRVLFNVIKGAGRGIPGNQNQNDHSSIYLQTDGGLVHGNVFENESPVDPFTAPAGTVNAFEIHGTRTLVSENIVRNYTGAGNAVAYVHDSSNNSWINNRFYGITSNAFVLWANTGFRNTDLTFRGNYIEIENTVYSGGSAIFQNPNDATLLQPMEDLVIEDNTIVGTRLTSSAATQHGILLCGVVGGSISRNRIRNMQGCGINIEKHVTVALPVHSVKIHDNDIQNCGMHSGGNRIWGIRVINDSLARNFRDIDIDDNKIWKQSYLPVAAVGMRGIRIEGPGSLSNIRVGAGNKFENLLRAQRVEFTTMTNSTNVRREPRIIVAPRAGDPTFGYYEVGTELIFYSDPTNASFIGKYVRGGGSGWGFTWAASTAYALGVWIRNAAGTRIWEVVGSTGAGLSGATEPAPTTTIGSTYTDGDLTIVLRDTNILFLGTWGATSA